MLLASSSCFLTGPREAAPGTVARSFGPFWSNKVGSEDLVAFLRRRTAVVISGPERFTIETTDGRLSAETRFESEGATEEAAALGAAAALSADGYYLTAAHALAAGPTHVVMEAAGRIRSARVREVWSDAERDVALLHAELSPDAWFELAEDRALEAGETLFAFSHTAGPAAGELEGAVDLVALGAYEPLTLAHDVPLRAAHSGAPAPGVDGRLLGVHTSTGMDTIFTRRSFLVRVKPDELRRRIEEDRARALQGAAPLPPPASGP